MEVIQRNHSVACNEKLMQVGPETIKNGYDSGGMARAAAKLQVEGA